ncbi:hypothetical protein J1792_23195 [Streptomyces triculaminicus]|uniref:LmbE family protein n=2 Tax=Streptomyces TaxID=1883 RepID=A0A939FRL3_9ACTN|nr:MULTISPECIES: hypothetical protein [Streptomyces]MBO0655579.1 hypothetical protein [Streptomyces triculaminicus]QSY50593.1 hypothetical protein J3S04_06485 [Streptomyces griseocarneus]
MAVRTSTPTTGWLLRGKDGRLTAYAPASGGLVRWTETRPGGPEWTGPERFEVPGLEPHLSIAQSPEGYVSLAGLRRRAHDDGRAETDVVYTTQFQPGRALTTWRSIGTPYGQDWQRADQIGAPTAVVDRVGLHVFVRNAGGGVCGRRQDARGIWGPWTDMKGSHVLDTMSAAVTADGRVELLAPASEFVLRWRQEEPGGPLRRVLNTPAKPLAGSASSAPAADGAIAHLWRDSADRVLHVQRPAAPTGPGSQEGAEAPAPVAVPSLGGDASGPVAVLRTTLDGRECTILAQRAGSGLPAVAAYAGQEDEAAEATWSETGEECVGAPALALDAKDRVVVAALGADGVLRVARQRVDEPGLALGPWTRV